jgi:hypothetical protein
MKSLFDDGEKPPTLSERLSGTFSGAFARPPRPPRPPRPSQPKAAAPADPQEVLSPAERRKAMSGLNALEVKWSKAGLALAAVLSVVIPTVEASTHPIRKVANKVHGKTGYVFTKEEWILIAVVALLFCGLGFEGLRRRKRTLVAFTFFILGFSFTLIFAPLGFALIILGGWLLLRAYRIQKFGTANAKQAAREAAARRPRRERKQAARTPPSPTGKKPPTANKRYTPKAAPRRKVTKPTE